MNIAGLTGFSSYDYSTDIKAGTNGVGLSAGYSVPLGINLNLDVALQYVLNNMDCEYENKSEEGTYDDDQNTILVSVGFRYIFQRKDK